MKRRIVSLLSVFCLLLTSAPMALAAEAADSLPLTQYGMSVSNEANYVAQVNGTDYENLSDAVAALGSGKTLTLLADVQDQDIVLPAGATLDGDGHYIRGKACVRINAAGGTVRNVNFADIHNETVVDQETCDRYGFVSKTGSQSAIYANDLTGVATITGCTFDNIDWDAIQIAGTIGNAASIQITGNTFRQTNTAGTQLRYIHIEHTASRPSVSAAAVNATDNLFYNTKNTNAPSVCNIGIWKIKGTSLSLSGNWFESPENNEVSSSSLNSSNLNSGDLICKLYPARSRADIDEDNLQPIANVGSNIYMSLQDAVNAAAAVENGNVYLMGNLYADITVPATRGKLKIYTNGHDLSGNLSNHGTLEFPVISGVSGDVNTMHIINYGTVSFVNSVMIGCTVDNQSSGTLIITGGSTYKTENIKHNGGTVQISGGYYNNEPNADWLAPWRKAAYVDSKSSYQVSLMNDTEAAAAGGVARSGGATVSSRKYYKSLTECYQDKVVSPHLIADVTENVVRTDGERIELYCDGFRFKGSLSVLNNSALIYNGTAELDAVTADVFKAGSGSYKANVLLKGGTVGNVEVRSGSVLVIEGGMYSGMLTVKSGGALTVKGGYFTAGPSSYVDEGYTVFPSDKAGYTYMVKKQSDADVSVQAATGEPAVDITAIPETYQSTVESVAKSVEADSSVLAAAANEAASKVTATQKANAEAALRDTVTVPEGTPVLTYSQVYLRITPTAYDDSSKAVTMDIVPMSRIVASTADSADDIKVAGDPDIDNPNAVVLRDSEARVSGIVTIPITVELPSGFNQDGSATYYAKHTHRGNHYYYPLTIAENGGRKTASFTNLHGFSEFALPVTLEPAASITVNGKTTVYESLQDAVNDVQDGQTITATKTGTASVPNRTIRFQVVCQDGVTATIKDYRGAVLAPDEHGVYTVTRKSDGSGGSSNEITLTFAVNGGTPIAAVTQTAGATIDLSAYKTTREGYIFDGWYADRALTKPVTAIKLNAATTVYAKWTKDAAAHDCPSEKFTDVDPSLWYHEGIDYVIETGMMNGVSNILFAPNRSTTRGMIVTILYRLEGSPAAAGSFFDDVTAGWYYTDAVCWAAENGIVNGYGNGRFGPDDVITREQLAAILYRYAQYKEYDTSAGEDTNILSYTDAFSISEYAIPAMQWANAEGLIKGRTASTLVPQGGATRAETAKILMNFCRNAAK